MRKLETIVPSSDISVSWDQVPNDGLAHYLKIDEGVDAADDTDYITSTSGTIDEFGFVLPGDLLSTYAISFRARDWQSIALTPQMTVTLIVNGSARSSFDLIGAVPSIWATDTHSPADWSCVAGDAVSLRFSGGGLLGPARIGCCELILDYEASVPERPSATAASVANASSVADPGKPTASPAWIGPSSILESLAPNATAVATMKSGESE